MSGGAYDYLCYSSFEDLFYKIEDLEKMEKYLIRIKANDVAKDVRRLIEYLETSKNKIEFLFDSLNQVLRAIEWAESGDYDEEDVLKEIEEYRK